MTAMPTLTARFATDPAAGKAGIESWRSSFGHAVCELDIDPLPDGIFTADATLLAIDGFGMVTGTCSGASYSRPARLIRNDDFVFVINHEGSDIANQMGRECVIGPGQAVLMNAGETGGIVNRGTARFTTMRVPFGPLSSKLQDLGASLVKPVAADDEALKLLLNYVSVFQGHPRLMDTTSAQAFVAHVYDLIAVAVGARRDAATEASRAGLPAARLLAIKAMVARHVASGSRIGINDIAARAGLSPRYIQMLFERDGTTFSEYVLLQKLAAVFRSLVEGDSSRKIGELALESGFDDISAFNRAFRKHFGCAPSDIRGQQALDAS